MVRAPWEIALADNDGPNWITVAAVIGALTVVYGWWLPRGFRALRAADDYGERAANLVPVLGGALVLLLLHGVWLEAAGVPVSIFVLWGTLILIAAILVALAMQKWPHLVKLPRAPINSAIQLGAWLSVVASSSSEAEIARADQAAVHQGRRRALVMLLGIAAVATFATFAENDPEGRWVLLAPVLVLTFVAILASVTPALGLTWLVCQWFSAAPGLGRSVRRMGDVVTTGTVTGFIVGTMQVALRPLLLEASETTANLSLLSLVAWSVSGGLLGFALSLAFALREASRGLARWQALLVPLAAGISVGVISRGIGPQAIAERIVSAERADVACPTPLPSDVRLLSQGQILACWGDEVYRLLRSPVLLAVLTAVVVAAAVWPPVVRWALELRPRRTRTRPAGRHPLNRRGFE